MLGSGRRALLRCVSAGSYANQAIQAVLPRLRANDIDQEIKVAAIDCAGTVLAHFGGDLEASPTKDILSLLAERMRNESTRLPALRAVEACARSPAQGTLLHVSVRTDLNVVNMSATISNTAMDLSSFLRQASRELKQQSLVTLIALVDTPQVLCIFSTTRELTTERTSTTPLTQTS